MRIIWITWEHHRRTKELSRSLAKVCLYELICNGGMLYRYVSLLLKSLCILHRERPDVLIVQNPSVVLAIFAVTIGKLFASKVVVDAHNEGLKPFYHRYNVLLPLYHLIQRWACLTIVTNRYLADDVRGQGGRPFILEDRVPTFDDPDKITLQGAYNFVLISTFEKDEPFERVIAAAKSLKNDICIYITGNYQKIDPDILNDASSNVIFTGFLSEEDYANLLNSCDAVIDLTLIPDCLVCGAYEALSFGKPMILSDNRALRAYFSKGAVYTGHRPKDIADAVEKTILSLDKLKEASVELKKQRLEEWRQKLSQLKKIL